jgi:hypothetical protein
MVLFPERKPYNLYSSQLPSSLGLTQVKVTADLDNRRSSIVSWPAQAQATRYIVYASPNPEFRNKYKDVAKAHTSVEFETPIVIPEDYVFYFWVSYVNPRGQEVFIQDEPVFDLINGAFETNPLSANIKRDIIDGYDAKYMIEEIRRRHTAMIQMDGEDFYLYIAKLMGQSCVPLTKIPGKTGRIVPQSTPFYAEKGVQFDPSQPDEFEIAQSKDPDYQESHEQCLDCFGTGVAGGYLPKLRIRVRYGEMPRRIINLRDFGMEFTHVFNSWTLWHPRLKENDIIVRIRDGERFRVKQTSNSEWRGIGLHQGFNANSETRESIIYKISDERIQKAIEGQSSWDVGKWDWAVWN